MKLHWIIPALPFCLCMCSVLKPVKDTSTNHILDPLVAARRITGTHPHLAIARPSLPSYLDRQELVTRTNQGELLIHDGHVWAEPLAAGISRVTAANLARLTNSLNIQPVEFFVAADYTMLLEVRFTRFEADATQRVVLDCTWKLQAVSGPLATTHAFATTVPFTGTGPQVYAQRTAAMNEALARLARDIARKL